METTIPALQVPPPTAWRHSAADPRRPRRIWLWVSLALVAGAIAVGSLVWSATSAALQQVERSGPAPTRYYLALVDQNYARAYAALGRHATIAGRPVDAQSFATLARAVDRRDGSVRGFIIDGEKDPTHLTLAVTRPSGSYTVHLQLSGTGAVQRIVKADRL